MIALPSANTMITFTIQRLSGLRVQWLAMAPGKAMDWSDDPKHRVRMRGAQARAVAAALNQREMEKFTGASVFAVRWVGKKLSVRGKGWTPGGAAVQSGVVTGAGVHLTSQPPENRRAA